jgi:hypothetical protein
LLNALEVDEATAEDVALADDLTELELADQSLIEAVALAEAETL